MALVLGWGWDRDKPALHGIQGGCLSGIGNPFNISFLMSVYLAKMFLSIYDQFCQWQP